MKTLKNTVQYSQKLQEEWQAEAVRQTHSSGSLDKAPLGYSWQEIKGGTPKGQKKEAAILPPGKEKISVWIMVW